jgi:hypothetical protein
MLAGSLRDEKAQDFDAAQDRSLSARSRAAQSFVDEFNGTPAWDSLPR